MVKKFLKISDMRGGNEECTELAEVGLRGSTGVSNEADYNFQKSFRGSQGCRVIPY